MNAPNPVPSGGFMPTGSTVASIVGGQAAAVILGTVEAFAPNVHFGDGYSAALGGLIAAAIGYFFLGGRKGNLS